MNNKLSKKVKLSAEEFKNNRKNGYDNVQQRILREAEENGGVITEEQVKEFFADHDMKLALFWFLIEQGEFEDIGPWGKER